MGYCEAEKTSGWTSCSNKIKNDEGKISHFQLHQFSKDYISSAHFQFSCRGDIGKGHTMQNRIIRLFLGYLSFY